MTSLTGRGERSQSPVICYRIDAGYYARADTVEARDKRKLRLRRTLKSMRLSEVNLIKHERYARQLRQARTARCQVLRFLLISTVVQHSRREIKKVALRRRASITANQDIPKGLFKENLAGVPCSHSHVARTSQLDEPISQPGNVGLQSLTGAIRAPCLLQLAAHVTHRIALRLARRLLAV